MGTICHAAGLLRTMAAAAAAAAGPAEGHYHCG